MKSKNLSETVRSNGSVSSGGFSCLLFTGAIWSFVGLRLTVVGDDKLVVAIRLGGGGRSFTPVPNKPEKL